MPKLDPIQNINRISDDVKRIVWICQNCKKHTRKVGWVDGQTPFCLECHYDYECENGTSLKEL